MAKEINQSEFEQNVLGGKGLSVVDFFATWCKPCQMLSPVIEEISKKYQNIHFYKIDIDQNAQLADKYYVMSVPTIMFFKDGQLLDQVIGYRSVEEMDEIISKFV